MKGGRTMVRYLYVLASFVLVTVPSVVYAQDPVVSGTTSLLAKGRYEPLDGVEITVYRKAPAGQTKSKGGGTFSVACAAGTPVQVLFRGPTGELPALQSLKADTGTKHNVHVTLFTVEDAKAAGINVYAYIRALIDQLLASGVSPKDPQVISLRELMNKYG
jgi:hypothetical protein